MKRIYAIVLRQFYLLRKSPSRIVPYFLWAVLDIMLWGFITKYITTEAAGVSYLVATLLGAILLWDFFTRVMQGITMAFFEDVWSRNFLNIFGSPMTLGEYVAGLTLSSIFTTTFAFAIIVASAFVLFNFSFFSIGLPALAFLFVLFLVGIALGIFSIAIVLRFGPSAEWFIWPIPSILAPFVGVFYPIATLPEWVQWVAAALPPSYVFEGLRSLFIDGTFELHNLMIAAVLSFICIGLAYWFLHSVFKHALKTGLIARYSAESTSI